MLAQNGRAVDVDVHGRPAADHMELAQRRDDVLRDPEIALDARPQRPWAPMDGIEPSRPAAADEEIAVGGLLECQMPIGMSDETRD